MKYDKYRNENKIDNNDKALFDSKITSHISNKSLNDKNKISFYDESIPHKMTE